MSLVIQEITRKEIWNEFLDQARPHTFLQSWNWGEFNEKMGSKVWRFGIFEGKTMLATALVLKIQARRGAFLFVPHGPIIATIHPEGADDDPRLRGENCHGELVESMTIHLSSLAKSEHCAFLRISPLLLDTPEHRRIFKDLKFRNAPIHMMHPELAWILDVTPSEDELLAAMRKQTRYDTRKAQKDGVEILTSSNPDDLEMFWSVYEATGKRQQFTTFSKTYLKTELETFLKDDRARLFFANYQGDTVSTALIVFSKNSAFYHHGASIHKYPKLTPSHLLQWEVIREAKRRGCHYYNFWGIVPEDLKNHPWAGLSLFKRGFGGFAEAYVHAQDLIVSPKYWLNWGVEKVRRIRRGL